MDMEAKGTCCHVKGRDVQKVSEKFVMIELHLSVICCGANEEP
jgi:hypothetical protein